MRRLSTMILASILVSATIPAYAQVGPDAAVRTTLKWSDSQQRTADWLSTGLVAVSAIVPCLHDRTKDCYTRQAINTAIGVGLAEGTKRLVHRPRPNGEDNLSFFSEHTMLPCLWTLRTKAWGFCPAVGYLRIAADKHWLTDVSTGAAVGAMIGTLSW